MSRILPFTVLSSIPWPLSAIVYLQGKEIVTVVPVPGRLVI